MLSMNADQFPQPCVGMWWACLPSTVSAARLVELLSFLDLGGSAHLCPIGPRTQASADWSYLLGLADRHRTVDCPRFPPRSPGGRAPEHTVLEGAFDHPERDPAEAAAVA